MFKIIEKILVFKYEKEKLIDSTDFPCTYVVCMLIISRKKENYDYTLAVVLSSFVLLRLKRERTKKTPKQKKLLKNEDVLYFS